MNFPGKFVDRIMPDKLHQISLSFLADKLSKQFGGTACNIGYTLKLLGIEPLIVSSAGNDFAPYKEHLQKYSISTKHIPEFQEVPTGSYHVVTDQNDNQIAAFYAGPMEHNQELSLDDILEPIRLVVVSPHDHNAMMKHVSECITKKIPYLFDPAFQIDHFSKTELLRGISGATILIGNDYEMALIEKKTGLVKKDLLKLVPIVITTLGANGSWVETMSESLRIPPAKPINTSDPTGAGDAYRAGFVAGFLRGLSLSVCGRMGSVASVYTVETYGTQTHTFTKKEFAKRYQENFGEKLNL